ncbi:MAG TPA: universal stress protein, partial [Chitinophagaceae bacterium]|nr:universal stress protein [Chitinophagaceae bacterium]
ATLIVMGITGKSGVKQVLFGSNTLKLIDNNLYPVMIIPPDAGYHGISNVAFASDFKNVTMTTPSVLIGTVLEMFNPKLHIVNINPAHYVSITEECRVEKEKLEAMFSKYETEFYFIGINDFFEAIDNFVKDYHIDVLVTIPKHQSNSTPFFKRTHTHKLAFHSHIPILAAHE